MIKTSVKQQGFEGILYPGNGSKEKAVIVMSGSNGGMTITRKEAEFYDRNGIPALALALFKTKDTPKNLDRIPIEYVESAIHWLKEKGYQKIAIDGTSKGSEMALLAASMFSLVSCVIARVPSHFVSEGLKTYNLGKNPSGTSSWSWQKKELPFSSYKMREFNLKRMLLEEKELHMIRFNKDKDIRPESLIPIEKIQAPVLLLSSKYDSVWPSYESANYIEKRLKESGFKYPVKHIAYEHMSHMMLAGISPLYRLAFITERKYPKECAKERAELRKELLDWIQNIWS